MTVVGKNHCRLFAVFIFLGCHLFSSAQLTANFTASPSLSGCSPLVINFTDASTGNPTQWKWDLGNGVTSLLKNPSATYFNPGTYTIKLLVRNASGSDSLTKTDYITVFQSPTPNFTADKTTGCFPLNVNFTDASAAGSGTIASWLWDFGDGTTSTLQNPSHIYTAAGNYNITLKVINTSGCTKTFTKAQYITVADGVIANFINTVPGLCPAPASINFTNTSAGPGPLSYSWNFGDGNSSTITDPSHTYNANGIYTVMLIVTSPQGCTDTVRKPALFTIENIKADFTGPDTVCVNDAVTFTNSSAPTPLGYSWSFGNGNFSSTPNGTATYNTPGTYTVKLVSNFGACEDSVLKQIYVAPKPQPAFDAITKVFCSLPASVSFTNQTPGSGTVVWDFGDGGTSTQNNPTHIYNIQGNFTVTLTVTNAFGCSTTLTQSSFVQIDKPQVAINGLPRSGCAPVTIFPLATITTGHTITSYLWSFGDGTTSTSPTPSHTYNGTGTYSVHLVYTTSGGCTDSVVVIDAVKTGTKPTAAFTVTPKDACAFQPVSFMDNSTPPVTQWLWDFGDGSSSTSQNPVHQYSDTGWFHVQLIVFNNTCPDTIRIMNAVHIRPPIANFMVQNSCTTKYTKKFIDASIGATSWFWTFGDGATSSQQSPTHTYNATGTYPVTLTVSNDTCSHSYTLNVRVINEKAQFHSADTVICRNQTATFYTSGIDVTNIGSWQWNFGDGNFSNADTVATHAYSASGNYMVTLIISDALGCNDTASLPVKVHGPVANFYVPATIACLANNNTLFSDLSTPDAIHPIVKWEWNYGDGTIDSSGVQPYQHSYNTAGNYTVSLLVKDNFGCTDIITKPAAIIISQPKADFFSVDTITCTGKPIQFTNTSSGNTPQYVWTFGDAATSTATNPVHNYGGIGSYTISLLAIDQYGCRDSITKPSYINISYPKAKFTVSDSVSTCPPLLVKFFNASTNYTALNWNFGDGTSSSLDSPSHFYTTPGIYFATLTVSGPGGCTDIASQRIEIKGPSGSFTYTPVSGCKPLTVSFTATSKNNATYTWDFADGNLTVTTDSTMLHTYTYAGDFIPKLILTDAGGCSVPITGTEIISVTGVTAGFDMGPSTFCNDGTVQFSNTSVSNDFITSYQWNFGDGATSAAQNPAHHYAVPGVYSVSLVVSSQFGCTDSLTLVDTVKVYANPVISIIGDSTACAPAKIAFDGNVALGNPSKLSWVWDFGNGQADTLQHPNLQTYSLAGNYSITAAVIDDHGCRGNTSKSVVIHDTPVPQILGDSTSCTPSSMNFSGVILQGGSPNLTWNWNMGNGQSYTAPAPPAQAYAAGHYTITAIVNNAYGCTDTAIKDINIYPTPAIDIVGDSSGCSPIVLDLSGIILQGDSTDLTWNWSMGKGQSFAVQHPPVQSYSNGTFTITATVATSHGCTAVASKKVDAHNVPNTDLGPDIYICRGNFAQLNATGAATYVWNANATLSCTNCAAPLAAPIDSTKYYVTGTTLFGCSSFDSVTVRVHQPFILQVGPGDTICSGSTVHLKATGADKYTWVPSTAVTDPAAGITTANPTSTTIYKVIAKDNFGCFNDTGYVAIKVWPYPTVDAGPDKTVAIGTAVVLKPKYSSDITSYAWNNPLQTLSCTTCPQPTVNTKGAQNTYAIKVKNDGGCVAVDEVTVYTICNGGNLFIPNTFSPNADGKNDRFYPRGSGIGKIKSLRIYDRWGEIVFAADNFSANDPSVGWDGLYKGKSLPPDVYVYTCEVVCMNNEVLTYNGNVTLLK